MERDKIIEKFNTITDVKADKRTLYEVMTELGIQFKKTNCVSCLKDYYNIVREELGMIEDASVLSDFDREYIYIPKRAQTWNGYIIDDSTPVEIIKEFIKKHPKGYYKINENTMKTTKKMINLTGKQNAVGEMYSQILGMPIVGDLMTAAAGASKGDDNFTVVAPVFFCTTSTIYLYIIVENPVTEEDLPTADYKHNSSFYDMRLNEGLEITEETIPQLLLTFPDFDFTPYIGEYVVGFIKQDDIAVGDTYKFRVNGNDAGTYTAACHPTGESEPTGEDTGSGSGSGEDAGSGSGI